MGRVIFTNHGHEVALWNVLHSIAAQRHIVSYLEVGVRHGDSLKVVLEQQFPERVWLCDTWGGEYGGGSFGNPAHVRMLLRQLKYPYAAKFLNGNSHKLLKGVTEVFDLITVDGDHSAAGAREDLEDCWPLLMPDGLLVFDDIAHPTHPELAEVFRSFVESVNAHVIHEDTTPMGVGVLCKIL